MSLRRRVLARALVFVLLIGTIPLTAEGSAEASPYCGIWWGSLRKDAIVDASPEDFPRLTNARSGQHACFDRLVFDVRGVRPGYDVSYTDQVLRHDEGDTWVPVHVGGGAKLNLLIAATRYDPNGRLLYVPKNTNELVNVSGYRTFRQVKLVDDEVFRAFDDPSKIESGMTQIGLGVRARLPFRVFTLPGLSAGTSRLVIDVAHRW